jgi:hypothetical protein
VSAENRLTPEQLVALGPGDTVTIETSSGDRRPSLTTGTVVRVEPTRIVVSVQGRGGKARFVEHYGRRDGVRVGRGNRAELVAVDPEDRAARDLLRRRTHPIDVAYRDWSRRRGDVDALRRLRDLIEEHLEEAARVER